MAWEPPTPSPEMKWARRAADAEDERDRWIVKYAGARAAAWRNRRAFVMASLIAFVMAMAALVGWVKLEIFAK